MRVAIAGLGAAAMRGHLPALLTLESEGKVSIVGACDPDRRRCLAVKRALPKLSTFGSAVEMLESIDPELLVIAAHPEAHADLAVLGAAHNQHILCEKPAGSTPAQVSELAAIRRQHSERGLVACYQYRFSRPWVLIARFLRGATESQRRVVMSVDVQRPVTDRHALSNWREDPAMGGGLADHAVHFLALARQLGSPLEVVSSEREYDLRRREQVKARFSAGSNLLELSVSYRAPGRSTSFVVTCGEMTLRWKDRVLTLERAGRRSYPMAVPSLSDRSHVDALYGPMYRDLVAGLWRPEWRRRRAEELLEIGQVLTVLLAEAEPVSQTDQPFALAA